MIKSLAILIFVLVVSNLLYFMFRGGVNENLFVDPEKKVYRLNKIYRWIPVIVMAVGYLLMIIAILFDEKADISFSAEALREDAMGWIFIHVAFVLGWLYLYFLKVYFQDGFLVRSTVLGERRVPLSRVYEIVRWRSPGNPIAGITRVYARVNGRKKKIPIESMIDGYEDLIRIVEDKAPKAKYIEK